MLIMLRVLKSAVAAAALAGVYLTSPAIAQSASEMAVRVQLLEEQVRSLSGQVEQLTYQMQQLQVQSGQKSGAIEPLEIPAAPPTQQKRLADASGDGFTPESDGTGIIEGEPLARLEPADGNALPQPGKDTGVQVLGALGTAAAQAGDGGFQGQVLVPPSQQEPGDDAFVQQGSIVQQGTMPDAQRDDSIETVSLSPDTAESLYEKSNESLLRRQFSDAEAGFSTFLTKYPDHDLAGSAQYWLGETYYAQRDYKRAAQSFLQGYKKYPKGRRAPDSLLKLGVSLRQLGQEQQACAAYAAVSSEYPKAVEARRRAQAEAKRAGCSS